MNFITRFLTTVVLFYLSGCTGMPEQITPVKPFSIDRYLGTWYEIARLDHSFERGLSLVSATYSLNEDGSVKVINRGYNQEKNEWKEAEGKAKFVGASDTAHLKVSFFGPFYGSYVVFHLEPDYSTALVSSYNTEYFWILSRDKSLHLDKVQYYLSIAEQKGFDTSKIIFPQQ
ncbi:lipocalin family protein [Photobacterium sp. OFAV2-7]|uniref:lipocalin family protein n=1 Tax=Photobacterium sp. OFAV2-7 TaxID=2917748 RepID=UPI001EF4813D|nr:lipocalin family protein [Photobacterium sp. OFAV2-7]MCG7585328.1 lipocalin family protein [Photobacterium sp. OFAV2-7]